MNAAYQPFAGLPPHSRVMVAFSGGVDSSIAACLCQQAGMEVCAVTMVQLLPYHNLGVMKYLRISDEPVAEATPPSDAYMEKLKDIMSGYGLHVTIH